MEHPPILHLLLHPPLLATARAGKLGFLARLRAALEPRGWQIEIMPATPEARAEAARRPGHALVHMDRPIHDRALCLRLAYHYPFWRIERAAERWRHAVARAEFDPGQIDAAEAADFAARLRARVLPGPEPSRDGPVLIALQGRLRVRRSFQTASPLAMVETVARTGLPCLATLHPRAPYDDRDRAALDRLAGRFPNLSVGGDTAAALRACRFVVTENSATGFDGLILGKPVVLFAQSDFHHIALNAADLGAAEALARAPGHRPDHARYLDWFLRRQSLDMMAADAEARILAALRRGGWPV